MRIFKSIHTCIHIYVSNICIDRPIFYNYIDKKKRHRQFLSLEYKYLSENICHFFFAFFFSNIENIIRLQL